MNEILARIIEWSVAHKLIVLLSSAALAIAGTWALVHTPIDAIPIPTVRR